MKTFYFLLGILLVPTGITVFMLDTYLAKKLEELQRRGWSRLKIAGPIFGPWIGIVFILAGVAFLLYSFFL